MTEKTSCYDSCPINHRCKRGYLDYNPICGQEIDRQVRIYSRPDTEIKVVSPPQYDGFALMINNESGTVLIPIVAGYVLDQVKI